MGKSHQEQIELKVKLEQAKEQVEVGAQYRHYKAADKIYTVLNLGLQEEDNEPCVIYQAEYEERLIFIRPLVSWIMEVKCEGETVPRFTKL